MKRALYIAGFIAVCVWLYVDFSPEPVSVLLLSLAYWGWDERGLAKQQQLRQEHPERFDLVQELIFRSHVNQWAPTRNQLLLILLSRHPRWTSKWYLERSLRDQTQAFEDSVRELRQGGHIIERWPFFITLSGSGLRLAENKAADYARHPM